MSGDVQPRKRKDKRRKKGQLEARQREEYLEEREAFRQEPPDYLIEHDVPNIQAEYSAQKVTSVVEETVDDTGSNFSSDEHFHVHKDGGTGGNICAKIVFFLLLGALAVMVGLILVEYRGSSDLDAHVAESRWAPLFDGLVDDSPVKHDDEPAEVEESVEHDEEGHSAEDEHEEHEEHEDGHDLEESEEAKPGEDQEGLSAEDQDQDESQEEEPEDVSQHEDSGEGEDQVEYEEEEEEGEGDQEVSVEEEVEQEASEEVGGEQEASEEEYQDIPGVTESTEDHDADDENEGANESQDDLDQDDVDTEGDAERDSGEAGSKEQKGIGIGEDDEDVPGVKQKEAAWLLPSQVNKDSNENATVLSKMPENEKEKSELNETDLTADSSSSDPTKPESIKEVPPEILPRPSEEYKPIHIVETATQSKERLGESKKISNESPTKQEHVKPADRDSEINKQTVVQSDEVDSKLINHQKVQHIDNLNKFETLEKQDLKAFKNIEKTVGEKVHHSNPVDMNLLKELNAKQNTHISEDGNRKSPKGNTVQMSQGISSNSVKLPHLNKEAENIMPQKPITLSAQESLSNPVKMTESGNAAQPKSSQHEMGEDESETNDEVHQGAEAEEEEGGEEPEPSGVTPATTSDEKADNDSAEEQTPEESGGEDELESDVPVAAASNNPKPSGEQAQDYVNADVTNADDWIIKNELDMADAELEEDLGN